MHSLYNNNNNFIESPEEINCTNWNTIVFICYIAFSYYCKKNTKMETAKHSSFPYYLYSGTGESYNRVHHFLRILV